MQINPFKTMWLKIPNFDWSFQWSHDLKWAGLDTGGRLNCTEFTEKLKSPNTYLKNGLFREKFVGSFELHIKSLIT